MLKIYFDEKNAVVFATNMETVKVFMKPTFLGFNLQEESVEAKLFDFFQSCPPTKKMFKNWKADSVMDYQKFLRDILNNTEKYDMYCVYCKTTYAIVKGIKSYSLKRFTDFNSAVGETIFDSFEEDTLELCEEFERKIDGLEALKKYKCSYKNNNNKIDVEEYALLKKSEDIDTCEPYYFGVADFSILAEIEENCFEQKGE